MNESRNWRDTLIDVLPRRASIGMCHRLLEVWTMLVWCVNASLRARDGQNMRLPNGVQELASSVGMSEPSFQQVMQALAQRQLDLVEQDLVDTYQRSDLNHLQQKLTPAIGGLERIPSQPLPFSPTIRIQSLSWVYGYLVFLKLDSLRLFSAAVVGWLAFLSSLMAEKNDFFWNIY